MEPSVDRARAWRCLIGDGATTTQALELGRRHDGDLVETFAALDRLRSAATTGATVRIHLGDHDDLARDLDAGGALAALLRRLDQMPTHERRALLRHHIGDDALGETGRDATDLARADALLAVGRTDRDAGELAGEALLPLAELSAPPALDATERSPGRRWLAAVGVAVMLVAGQLAVSSLVDSPRPITTSATAPPPTAAPPTTVAPASSTSTTERYTEPDREIEVWVTTDNTLIRSEPWTRRVIWESRPFRGPVEIVRVDPNTVAIEYAGERLVMSLADGTLLPP